MLWNPCILRGPQCQVRGENEYWLPHPYLLGAQKRAEVLCNACIARSPRRQAQGKNQKWLAHPCILKFPEEGGSAT